MKSTKKSLLLSTLSLIMCVAMLLGTTYAWFTDSVTSGKNKIQAGNLDIDLEYATFKADGSFDKWNSVTETTALFEETSLWEPGYTQVAYLKISNKGTLALKYQFGINVIKNILGKSVEGNDIDLTNILKFGIVEKDAKTEAFADRNAARNAVKDTAIGFNTYSASGNLTATGDSKCLAIVVYMPETVGNEANHNGTNVPSIEFGLSAIATQYTYEKDSFNERYDATAQYPQVKYEDAAVKTTADKLRAAITAANDGDTIIVDGAVQLEKEVLSINKNITIKAGPTGATFSGMPVYIGKDKTVTLEGLTFNDPTWGSSDSTSAIYAENLGSGKLTLKNCTFKNCKWDSVQLLPKNESEIVIDGCTFSNDTEGYGQRFIHIEGQETGECTAKISITNCKFGNDTQIANSLIDVDYIDYKSGNGLVAYGNTFGEITKTGMIFVCGRPWQGNYMDDATALTFFTKAN